MVERAARPVIAAPWRNLESGIAVRAIAQVVLEYLQAHPQAADTAEGISGWWLGSSRPGARVDSVVEALEALVARGELTRETTPAGETVYRLRGRAN